jgi:hypothetical protein
LGIIQLIIETSLGEGGYKRERERYSPVLFVCVSERKREKERRERERVGDHPAIY